MRESEKLSLSQVRDRLLALPHPYTREGVQAVVSRLAPGESELAPYLNFSNGEYTRTLFYRGERFEMLVLCWRDGQYSPIHDHAASICSMAVVRGDCRTESYRLAGGRASCRTEPGEAVGLEPGPVDICPEGDVTTVVGGDIHRVGNGQGDGRDLVTVHFYLPPIAAMRCYDPDSGVCRIVEPRTLAPRT